MIPVVALPISPRTMLSLLQFIEQSNALLSPAEIADQAILGWLESRREETERPPRSTLRGYQWKCLFLPEGTRLRVWCRHEHGYAEVVGDKLMSDCRSVSPNQFVAACADTVRNAWVEINVLMPGETAWKLASVRRREIEAVARLAKERDERARVLADPASTATEISAQPGRPSSAASAAPRSPLQQHATPHSKAGALDDDEFELSVHPQYQAGRRGKCKDRRNPRAPLDRRD
jgi:hypothetical protein